jgi:hypothetical protein
MSSKPLSQVVGAELLVGEADGSALAATMGLPVGEVDGSALAATTGVALGLSVEGDGDGAELGLSVDGEAEEVALGLSVEGEADGVALVESDISQTVECIMKKLHGLSGTPENVKVDWGDE